MQRTTANKDNMHCSIYWLADQIKEIAEGNSYLGDLEDLMRNEQ